MKRSTRMEVANQTVEIVQRGSYVCPDGRTVEFGDTVRACLDGTTLFSPEDLKRLRNSALTRPAQSHPVTIEVENETTLAGIARMLARGSGPVAALNFASAKNPGGGFLNGSEAQEESLARSSALYASQCRAWDFYERHRSLTSLLYTDAMILSPDCPVIRDDQGSLLGSPHLATFITSAAPNAGATAKNRPTDLPLIPDVFQRRSEYVLALAASHGYKNLVLGAWGCGVFGNDPNVVAAAFFGHLRQGIWSNRFERVVFSVLDKSSSQETIEAFQGAAKAA